VEGELGMEPCGNPDYTDSMYVMADGDSKFPPELLAFISENGHEEANLTTQ
jgi:hypothetical protein